MITGSTDGKIMVRRCLVTFKPFRIFVVGIGFFSLCFLMTSLGGQFSAKRLGDSPFTIRTEVLGGVESRGVLRKISDMLEVILKRMDSLSKLDNTSTTDARRLDELSSAINRFQPAGLVERIQAIAQNVSNMAIRVEQILQNSMVQGKAVRDGTSSQCEVPRDPRFPECPGKVDWMRARWTSDPCYAFYGVDGSDCSFLIYLSEVEWFCPPLTWRNHSSPPTQHAQQPKTPKRQAAFRTDLSVLLDQVGTGKESLSFMKRRIHRLAKQWATAANRLDTKLEQRWRDQKKILVHVGFLTEESGDVFSPKVLKGGPLGEMVQWADILTALHVLGHNLKISMSVKELQGFLGVPPGRGSCPLTGPLPFDLIYTDYHGLQQMKQHMGLSLKKHKCHIRVIDTFGTEPAYNHEEYATLHGYRTNWGYWNLNARQYMTMFPHTPDNSFMGFVSEELNETEKRNIQQNKVNNMAVVYGKEASMWKLQGKEGFLQILHRYMEVHGTVYYETQRPPEVPAFVKNHGLLPQHELQQLLRKAKLFIGFGFPYEGPAPLEAIANGCIFLQPKFQPPHSSLNHEFFRGKPTSREVSSQHPYAEQYIGRPHVMTVDYNNSLEFDSAIREIMRTKVEPYLPYEYTCEGMLERVHAYIQNQDFCNPEPPFIPANLSRQGSAGGSRITGPLFVTLPNSTTLGWASNVTAPPAWPPLSSLRLLVSQEGQSCVEACQSAGFICEPAHFRFINNKEALRGLEVQCEVVDSEINHILPAFSVVRRECGLQRDPLLFSCAGHSPKYRRLCPCRDFRRGQVALCRDCL
ncbi:alpha-1,6-mannosylglycoprotein 6-beta-N-acetylglucosaminyltransferase B-like isoform X2 [Thunnus albacares]|uniref:alpha-1,6-mannosylglycoprotein 6-beta-N-acetylglucosaminyltransferase B-like isoform X2 n=1 Tax=Thunnus maccoyii TaxID=8240 RepID=UPI001C4D6CD5|nr:alpha-1,6-mannosylglycoprotein 6-beta-N-acetylglucosaminyltransferase B-like isoform X2 [Thunnus maccoyii]XP_044201711.1 alpha-1,6-mannosylglycoprotein 6-beta-N-acetylglucosaminyltransferase B-like isoform X2 [Thunnus albacares]